MHNKSQASHHYTTTPRSPTMQDQHHRQQPNTKAHDKEVRQLDLTQPEHDFRWKPIKRKQKRPSHPVRDLETKYEVQN